MFVGELSITKLGIRTWLISIDALILIKEIPVNFTSIVIF